jgi:hypothetical protein
MTAIDTTHNRVFKPGTEFQRDTAFYESLPLANSLAALADFKRHGVRRKKLNPVFSSSAISEGLSTLSTNLDDLGEILAGASRDNKSVDIQSQFFYLTVCFTHASERLQKYPGPR